MKKFLLSFSLVSTLLNSQVPYQVKDICPGSCQATNLSGSLEPFVYNNKIFFGADDGVNGQELWVSDGTLAGTNLVKNIAPGNLWAPPSSFYIYNSKLYFESGAMWVTDGTTANTNSVSPLCYSGKPFEHNNIMYWSGGITGTGQELVRSDGTTAGTYVLKDIWPGIGNSYPSQYISASGPNFFFVANDGTTGEELWYSDGTSGGTVLVKDIRPGSNSSTITMLKYSSGILYFQANDGVNGKELWRSDGTALGTFMLKDFNPGSGSMSAMATPTIYNNKFFFGYGMYVWESNGSIAGTITNTLVTGYSTCFGISSNLYLFNNDLYYYGGVIDFSMSSVWDSILLYKISGTVTNQTQVKKMKPTTYVGNGNFRIIQTNAGKFITLGNGNNTFNGCVIISDGTNGGTNIVSCKSTSSLINPGLFVPYYYDTIPFLNNSWYYPLETSSNGYQIHRIDASTYNVSLLLNIGTNNFYGSKVITCGYWAYFNRILCNKFYFWADDGSTGTELWASDGTTGGTNLTLDIYPGMNSSIPSGCDDFARFAVTSDKFYFYAFDGVTGGELWAVSSCTPLGLNEINKNSDIKIYPNPTSNILNIKSNSKTNSEIEIISYLGQTVLKQKYAESIDVAKLSPGCYFIRIDNSYSKFIKE